MRLTSVDNLNIESKRQMHKNERQVLIRGWRSTIFIWIVVNSNQINQHIQFGVKVVLFIGVNKMESYLIV